MKEEKMNKDFSDEISTSELINFHYGMLSDNKKAKIKQALMVDEYLNYQYQGIVALINDFPDEDPEDILNKAAEDIIQRIPNAKNQSQTAKEESTPEEKGKKYASGPKGGAVTPGIVIPFFWSKFLAAAMVIFVLGIVFYNNYQNLNNKDVKDTNQDWIASERGTEEPDKKFGLNSKEGKDSLDQSAATNNELSTKVLDQIHSLIQNDVYELKGKLKSDLILSESKRRIPNLTKDFKYGRFMEVVGELEAFTNLTGNESFCLGYALLKTSQPDYEKAEQCFIKALSNSDVKKDAAYYLGISQIFNGKKSEGLSNLKHTDHPSSELVLKIISQ